MDKIELIERISYFRTKARLSQKTLSKSIGMNDGYINRLESKRDFLPSTEALLKIIEACGISEEEFFYKNVSSYEKDKLLIEKIGNLSKEKKEALLNFLA